MNVERNVGKNMEAMWSWIPDFGAGFRWLKIVLMYGLIIMVLAVGLCCFVQCLPSLCNLLQLCKCKQWKAWKRGPPPPYTLLLPLLTHPKQNLYNHKSTIWCPEEAVPLTHAN